MDEEYIAKVKENQQAAVERTAKRRKKRFAKHHLVFDSDSIISTKLLISFLCF